MDLDFLAHRIKISNSEGGGEKGNLEKKEEKRKINN